MPLIALVFGIVILMTALRGSTAQFSQLLGQDLSGQSAFLPFVLGFVVVGAIGFYKPLKQFSDSLLILLLVVLFVSKGRGFIDNLSLQTSMITGRD